MPSKNVGWTGQVDEVVPAAARTTSGDTGVLHNYGPPQKLRAQLNVTAVTGVGPTLDVVIEDTLDGVNWNTIGEFVQKTAVGRELIPSIDVPFTDRLRVRWTIGGTDPSFTFAVHIAAQ